MNTHSALYDAVSYELTGFDKYYTDDFREQVEPLVATFERERKLLLQKFIQNAIPCGIALCAAVLVYSFTYSTIALFFIFPSCASLFWLFKIQERYSQKIETNLLPPLAALYGMQYDANQTLSTEKLMPFGILPDTNITGKNYIFGSFDGGNVEVMDCHNLLINDNTIRYIACLTMLFKMEKIAIKTILLDDPTGLNLDGTYYLKKKLSDLKRVSLESADFNHHFQIYSADEVEARYLLTPGLMEKLLDVSALLRKFPGNNMFSDSRIVMGLPNTSRLSFGSRWCFLGNHLLIVISSRQGMYLPGSIFRPIDTDNIGRIMCQFHLIKQITEVLKLDPKKG